MTNTHYTITGNLKSGYTYYFRYRAHNVFGWGEWSDAGQILTASIPDTELPVIVTQEQTNVKLSWSANTSDNGSEITEYEVQIQTKDGAFIHDQNCDGTDTAIIMDKQCLIPMEVFTLDPYLLVQGDLIVAIVKARNSVGTSDFSYPNIIGVTV